MFRRVALMGVLVTVLGIAAVPDVSYSASTGPRDGQHAAKSAKAKPKKNKKVKKCKKGQVRKNGTCTKKAASPTSPPSTAPPTTPEALSATLVVHVSESGSPNESAPIYVAKLKANGQVLTGFQTSEHTVHVSPGAYEISALSVFNPTTVSFQSPRRVTVAAGQQLEVMLELKPE